MKIRYALAMAGMVSTLVAAPAFAQHPSNEPTHVMSESDNTNSRWSPSVFDTDLGPNASPYYSDSIRRDAYMQEQRRREAIERHELARAQEPYPYYTVPDAYNAAPNPTRVEPGTSATNPTGNEPAGESSGGK